MRRICCSVCDSAQHQLTWMQTAVEQYPHRSLMKTVTMRV